MKILLLKTFNMVVDGMALDTRSTWRCMIQLDLKTPLGKALIEENGCSLVKINNIA